MVGIIAGPKRFSAVVMTTSLDSISSMGLESGSLLTLILGPCRSASMATLSESSFAACLIRFIF